MANTNEYMREYMLKRYAKRRAYILEKLGGKCIDCGSTEQLECDHVFAEEKTVEISKIWNYSLARLDAALEECVLRCKSCHIAKTSKYGENGSGHEAVEHGGGISGKRNCDCVPCKARKAEYMRNYRVRK